MTVGPIPFTAIIDYFRVYDIEGDFEEFASIIRRMDDVFLAVTANDVTKKNSKKGENKNATSRRK